MKVTHFLDQLSAPTILLSASVLALAVALTASLAKPNQAGAATPPPVPENIQVPPGNRLFFTGHATGTQDYVCLPADTGVSFVLFTPQATLFDPRSGRQVMTHYFSPNPDEGGTVRATWQHSRDTSKVWGRVFEGHASTDPDFVAPGAIPWLLVTAVGSAEGPTGGDYLTETTYIQRVNTSGGVAPSTGCASMEDVGNRAYVPYETDYLFYKQDGR